MASHFWKSLRQGAETFGRALAGAPLTAPVKESTSLQRAMATGATPGWHLGNPWAELGHMSSWSFPAIDAIAAQWENASRVVYSKQQQVNKAHAQVSKAHAQDAPAPQRTPVHDHPMLDLLERPNPVFWGELFFYQLATHYCCTGGFVIWEVRDQYGKPCELWALPRAWLTFQTPSDQYPLGTWKVTNPRGLAGYGRLSPLAGGFYLDVRDTIVCNRPHPLYPGEPLGTMAAMAKVMDISEQTDTAVWTSWVEAPRPGMIVLVNEQTQMTKEALEQFSATIGTYKGGANNTGKVMVMQGMKVDRMGTSVNDLDSVNVRKQNQEFVNAAHSVPPIATGIRTETGSYAADAATINTWIELHIQTQLNRVAGCFNHRWHRYWPDEKLEISAKRADDPTLSQAKNNDLKDAVAKGGATWNEWRATQNLKPLPGLDEVKAPPEPQPGMVNNFHGGQPGQEGGVPPGADPNAEAGPNLDLDLPDDESTGGKRPDLQRAGGRSFSFNGNGKGH